MIWIVKVERFIKDFYCILRSLHLRYPLSLHLEIIREKPSILPYYSIEHSNHMELILNSHLGYHWAHSSSYLLIHSILYTASHKRSHHYKH